MKSEWHYKPRHKYKHNSSYFHFSFLQHNIYEKDRNVYSLPLFTMGVERVDTLVSKIRPLDFASIFTVYIYTLYVYMVEKASLSLRCTSDSNDAKK